jgi:hypothetical protein
LRFFANSESVHAKGEGLMRALVIGLVIVATGCSQQPREQPAPMNDDLFVAEPAKVAPANEGGTPYTAPADPNATYALLSVTKGKGGNIIAMTRRTGSSGTSYSNREIDCGAQLARYIGEGDTRADAEKPLSNPGDMASLVEGSSTWAAVQAACAKR